MKKQYIPLIAAALYAATASASWAQAASEPCEPGSIRVCMQKVSALEKKVQELRKKLKNVSSAETAEAHVSEHDDNDGCTNDHIRDF